MNTHNKLKKKSKSFLIESESTLEQ